MTYRVSGTPCLIAHYTEVGRHVCYWRLSDKSPLQTHVIVVKLTERGKRERVRERLSKGGIATMSSSEVLLVADDIEDAT